MSGEEGGSGKAVAAKRPSAEELAVQAQKLKRVKEFIATIKEYKKHGEALASELMGSIKETLLGDASFTDRLALAIAEKLAKSGEAIDALAKNPAFIEALSKNGAIVAAVSMRIAEDSKLSAKVCKELADDPPFRSKLVSKLSNGKEFTAQVAEALNTSPVFTDKLRANVDASVDAKAAKIKEAHSQVAQAQAAPQAVLQEGERKALDMLAEYSEEIEAVAQNVRSNKYLAMLLSDDPKAALADELKDHEEMALSHLKALACMDHGRLSKALSEAARKDPAVSDALSSGSMSESAFGQFITDKVELARVLYYHSVHDAVVRSFEGSDTEKSMDGLNKDHADAVLYSLNLLSSMLTVDQKDAELKAKSQPYLAKAMEGGFKAALIGPQMEQDLEELSASAPHFTARRLLECIKDPAVMEAVAGKNLASDPGYMDEVVRIYKNVLFRLVEDAAKSDDPQKKINALFADGHDVLGMLVEVARYPKSSDPMAENAKTVLRGVMASSFYNSDPDHTHSTIEYLLETDKRLARLLMRDLNSIDDAAFSQVIADSESRVLDSNDPDQVQKARNSLNREYFNSLGLVLYHSLLSSDLAAIRDTYSALVAEHGESARMCMRNLRRSAVALESCDPASKPVNGTAKELMRNAAMVMYPKGSIDRVADIVALDETHSNLDPWEELELVFQSDPQKTVLHLKSLQDLVTLKRALLDVTGASNVSDAYLDQRSAAVQEFYGTFLVSLAIRHLSAPDHQMRMSSLPAQHPAGWQEALDIVILHKDNRDGEVAKILPANSDPSSLEMASKTVLYRAKDYRYGIDRVSRVAAALIDQESDDLEHVFMESPGSTLANLRALSSNGMLAASEVEAISGQKPDQDEIDGLVQAAAENYGGMLASHTVRSLDSGDRVYLMRRIAEDHPDTWLEALSAVAQNNGNVTQYEIGQMYPASAVEEATRVLTGRAQRFVDANQMTNEVLSASVNDLSGVGIVRRCARDLDVGAQVLGDLSKLVPAELGAALSRAAGTPGYAIAPATVSRRRAELMAAYSIAVKLLVVDSQLDTVPSQRMTRYQALSADHGALAQEAVLNLSLSKSSVSDSIELLASLRGRPLDRSALKEQTKKVYDSLKTIPVSGGASK